MAACNFIVLGRLKKGTQREVTAEQMVLCREGNLSFTGFQQKFGHRFCMQTASVESSKLFPSSPDCIGMCPTASFVRMETTECSLGCNFVLIVLS